MAGLMQNTFIFRLLICPKFNSGLDAMFIEFVCTLLSKEHEEESY